MSRWITRQRNDPFVKARDQAQYVSRAAFKLDQLNKRFAFLTQTKNSSRSSSGFGALNILDLGAAPGGWIQVCARNNPLHNILALDLLPLDPSITTSTSKNTNTNTNAEDTYRNVTFHQQNLQDPSTGQLLDSYLKERPCPFFHVVLSDMLPNVSGSPIRDAAASIRLINLANSLAHSRLLPPTATKTTIASTAKTSASSKTHNYSKEGGIMILKALQSTDADDFVNNSLKPAFDKVMWVKPSSSRAESREAYLVCRGPRINQS